MTRSPDVATSGAINIKLVVNANTLQFAGAVQPPDARLSALLERLPPEAEPVRAWVPDIQVTALGVGFDPKASAVTTFASAGPEASAFPSADLLVGNVAVGSTTAFVAALSLRSSIDLSGTPLFGELLSGISIGDLTFSYATANIPANTIVPPPPARAPEGGFPAGPSLAFTISDGVSRQSFRLVPASPARRVDAAPELGETAPSSPPTQWFPIQKSFGPLTLGRIGIVTGADEFGIALDASVKTAVLGIELVGFSLLFSKNDISLKGVRPRLDGLGVAFSSGAFKLAGNLVRRGTRDGDEYAGSVLIQAGVYSIQGVGAFGKSGGAPSFFVFGFAEGAFGGPPAFFVTGLAAGFGYNRALRLPTPDGVADFPMVRAATNGSSYLPDPSVTSTLSKLNDGGWVPPRAGAYWVAAGVAFTSFKTIDGFALVTVQFGHELVIALLGQASVQLPKTGNAYARAQMTLDAVLEPAQGAFRATALLTRSSFVLHPDCRLQGGFAFYLWFGPNENAGDFVVTLGGYSAGFRRPKWYPEVPRLGFDWRVSGEVQIRGAAYFALTPSCVMGGGELSVDYSSGRLSAWFRARADFVMNWKPFSFEVSIGVSVGASYTTGWGWLSKTFRAELSAAVELWGPPVAGVARVNWWVISFTIPINGGARPRREEPLAWSAFRTAFLPDAGTPGEEATDSRAPLASAVCRPRAASGLTGTYDAGDETVWLVSGDALTLSSETVIPASSIEIRGPEPASARVYKGPAAGVYPMGDVALESKHTVRLLRGTVDSGQRPEDLRDWSWTPATGNFPEALWGRNHQVSPRPSASVVAGLSGISGTPPVPPLIGLPRIALATLDWRELPQHPLPVAGLPPVDGSTPPPGEDPNRVVSKTVATSATRDAIVQVLDSSGAGTGLRSGNLEALARNVSYAFPFAPMLGGLGTTGPKRVPGEERPSFQDTARPPAAQRSARLPSRSLRAVFRRAAGTRNSARGRPHAAVIDAFSSRWERSLAAAVQQVRRGTTEMRLDPGCTLLWDLVAGMGGLLEWDDPVVRVIAFDDTYELLDQVLPGSEQRSFAIPERATQVVVERPVERALSGAAGWNESTSFTQVAPQALVGDGVVVRPQAPQRVRHGRGSPAMGVVTGRDVARSNVVQSVHGSRSGWIEAWLPPATRSVSVTLQPDGAAGRFQEDAATVATLTRSGWTEPLVDVRRDGSVAHLTFPTTPGGLGPVSVRIEPEAGWRHSALIGSEGDAGALAEVLLQPSGDAVALDATPVTVVLQ